MSLRDFITPTTYIDGPLTRERWDEIVAEAERTFGYGGTMTIVTKLLDAQADIATAKDALGGGNGDAAREFALANTALEDAIMRVNRAFAKVNGTFAVADVEALTR